jgi:peptide/nickel transport system substrate-binding protein
VAERSTRTAALQAGRADVASPGDGSPSIAEQLRGAAPGMVITRVGVNFVDHLMLNQTRPPFNDVRLRRALSLAMDRAGFVKAVLQGGGVPGAALAPPPIGFWGLAGKEVPLGNDKARARALLAEAGHGPGNPLKLEVVTRNIAIYRDGAAFVVDQLRQVGVESKDRRQSAVAGPILTSPPPPASASAPRRRPRARGARSPRASAPARSAA